MDHFPSGRLVYFLSGARRQHAGENSTGWAVAFQGAPARGADLRVLGEPGGSHAHYAPAGSTGRLSALSLRLALIYGPGQAESVFVPSLIQACLRADSFAMSSGDQTRDYFFVDDAVDGFVQAASAEWRDIDVMNLASGRDVRFADVATTATRLIGSGRVEFGTAPSRTLDMPRQVVDVERAHAVLGWRASTLLEEGLSATIDWYRRR